MKLSELLRESAYKLTQFSDANIAELEAKITLKQTKAGNVPVITCIKRQKEIRLNPEEIVRQLYLIQLTQDYGYPLSRIEVEYGVHFGREVKRADIVIMDKDRPTISYIVVELKKPKLKDGRARQLACGQMVSKFHGITAKTPTILKILPSCRTPRKNYPTSLTSNLPLTI